MAHKIACTNSQVLTNQNSESNLITKLKQYLEV